MLFIVASFCFVQLHTLRPTSALDTKADDSILQRKHEWIFQQQVSQYSQGSSFSLLTFRVPARTQNAEFLLKFFIPKGERLLNKTAMVSFRMGGIPMIQVYNESIPAQFTLPKDEQTHILHTDGTIYSVTLSSPAPGPVYVLVTVLNPVEDIVKALRWNEPLSGHFWVNVHAVYTVRPNMTLLAIDQVNKIYLQTPNILTYSFSVPPYTLEYDIIISNCTSNTSNVCPLVVTVSESLADDNLIQKMNCTQDKDCRLTVLSPALDKESYLSFTSSVTGYNMSFVVSFQVQECQSKPVTYKVGNNRTQDFQPAFVMSSRTVNELQPLPLQQGVIPQVCSSFGELGRVSQSSDAFNAYFSLWDVYGTIAPITTIVSDLSTQVRTFTLQDGLDTGSTLFIELFIHPLMINNSYTLVRLCAMPGRLAYNNTWNTCPGGIQLLANSSLPDNDTQTHYLPFPKTGLWYVTLYSQCFQDSVPQKCEILPLVTLQIGTTQCPPNQCGNYGSCETYIESSIMFASCNCQAGYRGLACDDATYALTKGEQLQAVYLLTLSNFAFVPAIILALYRCHCTLAAVFFFNFFFSTFYHACDTSRVYFLCITDYNTLSFCDFFGSVLSFWSTFVTMARLPERAYTFLLMGGALVIAVFQNSNRHGDVPHILPVAIAGFILIVSWAREIRLRHELFPSKRRYLFFLLPGILLALSGIVVNFTVHEASSYQYSHSYWHFALMVSPCFLMPPRSKKVRNLRRPSSKSAQKILKGSTNDDEQPVLSDASTSGSEHANLI